MQTVFSHIVQKRLSPESENVATAALAFILESSEAARNGLTKLLRGVVPQLPRLWFRTQQTDGANRPDMWGNDDAGRPHVLIENKFWAGLTENQPVSYLRILAKQTHASVLLIVAPKAREQTLARELSRKLDEAGIATTEQTATAGVVRCIATNIGPILALTSWETLLSFLELEVADDPPARSDLLQLKSLCGAMDNDAFVPVSAADVSDQRTPAFMIRLSSLVQDSVAVAVRDGILDCKRLNPQADATRIGRYAYLGVGTERQVCIWVGIHFVLWKLHGISPIWVVFSPDYGRSHEVRPLLEPWAAQTRVFTTVEQDHFAVAIDLPTGEERDTVISVIVERLKQMTGIVAAIKSTSTRPNSPGDQ